MIHAGEEGRVHRNGDENFGQKVAEGSVAVDHCEMEQLIIDFVPRNLRFSPSRQSSQSADAENVQEMAEVDSFRCWYMRVSRQS